MRVKLPPYKDYKTDILSVSPSSDFSTLPECNNRLRFKVSAS